jgi:SAM-dependent methyltransferase
VAAPDLFDSLHHSRRQADVVRGIARHLRPGGWVVFGEPSWLHAISPHARRVSREQGWVERGVTLRSLRRDCRHAGLGNFRRFFEPTRPYETRGRGFAWNLLCLVGANFLVAPQFLRWLAAQKPGTT